MTEYIRHTSGRLRTTWPQLKHNPVRGELAEAALSHIKGVISVKASSLTGNLFIRYDARWLERDMLLESVRRTIQQLGPVHAAPGQRHAQHLTVRRFAPDISHPSSNKLGGMLLHMLVEKSVERFAIALVAALL
jgi:hypothetical protein